jgi:predicted nucleic-acid-binding protein
MKPLRVQLVSKTKSKTFSIDTNILIRYITQDDNKQSKLATNFIESEELSKASCFITLPVIIETVWVLKRLYAADKNQIATVIETLLNTSNFIVQHDYEIENALDRFKTSSADFSDCLIIELSKSMRPDSNSIVETYTFDKKAVKAGMTLLK